MRACLQLLQHRYNSVYRNPRNSEFFSFGIIANHAHSDLLKTRSSKAIWNHNLLVEQSSDFKSLGVFAHPTLFWGSCRLCKLELIPCSLVLFVRLCSSCNQKKKNTNRDIERRLPSNFENLMVFVLVCLSLCIVVV